MAARTAGAHTSNQTQSNDSGVFKLSKPALGDILSPAKPLPLNLLQYHQLSTKSSTTESYGGHSYSSYSSGKIKEVDRITGEGVRLGVRGGERAELKSLPGGKMFGAPNSLEIIFIQLTFEMKTWKSYIRVCVCV